jgi:hypothetical protein
LVPNSPSANAANFGVPLCNAPSRAGLNSRRPVMMIRTSAASYSGQFVTRYRASENLWRRPSVNLYGMSLHNQQHGTASLSYGLAPIRHPSGIDPGVQWPPLRQGQRLPTTSGLFVHQGAFAALWRSGAVTSIKPTTGHASARAMGTPHRAAGTDRRRRPDRRPLKAYTDRRSYTLIPQGNTLAEEVAGQRCTRARRQRTPLPEGCRRRLAR